MPTFVNDVQSRLARDSLVVGLATVLSRLLGFARDMLIARLLGAGPVADAFLVAFRLPNLIRRVLGEGGLNAPFVPVYLDLKAQGGPEAARRFAGEACCWLALGLGLFTGVGLLLAPWFVLVLAGGFQQTPVTLALAVDYTRLALPFLALTTLASLLAAALNAEGRFLVAALGPALINLVLIAALLFASAHGSAPPLTGAVAAAGVSLAGGAHLAMVGLALTRRGGRLPRPSLRRSPALLRLFVLGAPALLAACASQLVPLVAMQIASSEPGAVSWLYYADRVFQLPLGFVAVAMGIVLLPAIAAQEAAGDTSARRAMIDRALVLGLALAVPAATALVMLADPIVSVLFERGLFGEADRIRTASALAAFALGLPCAVVAKVFTQVFFARQAPRIPLYAGLAALAVAALAGLAPHGPQPATSAALAASLAFLVQGAVLAAALMHGRLWRPALPLLRPLAGIGLAVLAMTAVLAALLPSLAARLAPEAALAERVGSLALLCFGGLAVYALAGRLLGAFRLRELGRMGRSG